MKTLELTSSSKIPDLREILKIFEEVASVRIVDLIEDLRYSPDQQTIQVFTTINFEPQKWLQQS